MAEEVPAAISAPAEPPKKKKAPRSAGPSVCQQIMSAVACCENKKGTSMQMIKAYLGANGCDVKNRNRSINTALVRLTKEKKLVHCSGVGANGRFKLAQKAEAPKKKTAPAKKMAKAEKKPAAKKAKGEKRPAPKKTTAEKKPAPKKAKATPAAKRSVKTIAPKKGSKKNITPKKATSRAKTQSRAAKPKQFKTAQKSTGKTGAKRK